MELLRYTALLRRWWWLLALGVLMGGLGSYTVSRILTPVYRASATVLVNQTQTPGSIAYNDILTSERLTRTYRELITQRPVLEEVARRLSIQAAPGTLAGMLDVDVLRDTQLIRVSAENADPVAAQEIANATAAVFIEQNSANQFSRPGSVSIVEAAAAPGSPVRPRVWLDTFLGAAVGLMLAAGLVALFEYMDDTVKSPQDVEALGLSALGGVVRFRRRKDHPADALVGARSHHPAAEAYRMVRTNVQFSTLDRPAQTLLITSANPGEGKTTTAVNLGIVMAQAGRRVVLVDSDLRRPMLHRFLGVPNDEGLTNLLLSGGDHLDGVLKPTRFENLRVLTCGPQPPNPSELLGSRRLGMVLENLKRVADVTILDSPPTLAVTDASILAAQVDGTILVVDSGRTRSGALERARENLTRSKTNLLGAVLNKLTQRGRDYYYYRYYRYYNSGPDGHRATAEAGSTSHA